MNFSAQSTSARRPRFSRLSLIQKIGLGYVAMALFTTAAVVFSSITLYQMNLTAREIAGNDLPVINALIELRGSLQAQQGMAGRYAILKDPAFIELFRQREKESIAHLAVLQGAQPEGDALVLRRMYAEYQADAQALFQGKGTGDRLRSSGSRLLDSVDKLYGKRQEALHAVVQQADRQRAEAIRRSVLISCAGFLLALGVAPLVAYRTFGAIRKLQRATIRIAAGDFDFDPRIAADQELDALAQDFARMAGRLKVLEQLSLDASPLTRLPGNCAIERVLEERLKRGVPFAFCHADLDNFKPYSDQYGYAKGSELLRSTGDLIQATVQQDGDPEAFVGHIGGDDFVMVLDVDRVAPVCEAVIGNFDAEVLRHYSREELDAKGIQGRDRYGVQRFFPITSISIAVIICGRGEFASAVEIAREAARVKDLAKQAPGSNYLVSDSQRQVSCSGAL